MMTFFIVLDKIRYFVRTLLATLYVHE